MNIDEATGSGHDLGQLLDARVMAMTLGLGLPEELMNIDEVTGSGLGLGQLLVAQVAGEEGLHSPGRCVSLSPAEAWLVPVE